MESPQSSETDSETEEMNGSGGVADGAQLTQKLSAHQPAKLSLQASASPPPGAAEATDSVLPRSEKLALPSGRGVKEGDRPP
jgi:hypothetical protein